MTRDEYLRLFQKFLAGYATPEEIELIYSYQDGFELDDSTMAENDIEQMLREKRIFNEISTRITQQKASVGYTVAWLAAAALIIFGTTALLFIKNKLPDNNTLTYTKTTIVKHDVKPGTNKALLVLGNGKQIALNDVNVGAVLKQGNISISKQKNGLLLYRVNANANKAVAVQYNTISTPVGGQYAVVLPDGSKVWLNAASSLKFPTAFTGAERKVELTGEGYFEVAKNKHKPFKVEFDNQEVEVLGTHFNIAAYADEAVTRTTLLEGSVRISKNNIKKVLVPGQQAIGSLQAGDLNVKEVNTDEAIAWKNGLFLFHNENIRSIMKQIARWYDIDVNYQGAYNNQAYGGRVSKSKNLSEILKNLELTGTIHFKIDGRRVTVMQ